MYGVSVASTVGPDDLGFSLRPLVDSRDTAPVRASSRPAVPVRSYAAAADPPSPLMRPDRQWHHEESAPLPLLPPAAAVAAGFTSPFAATTAATHPVTMPYGSSHRHPPSVVPFTARPPLPVVAAASPSQFNFSAVPASFPLARPPDVFVRPPGVVESTGHGGAVLAVWACLAALVVLLCTGLYLWNRWQHRGEPSEKSTRSTSSPTGTANEHRMVEGAADKEASEQHIKDENDASKTNEDGNLPGNPADLAYESKPDDNRHAHDSHPDVLRDDDDIDIHHASPAPSYLPALPPALHLDSATMNAPAVAAVPPGWYADEADDADLNGATPVMIRASSSQTLLPPSQPASSMAPQAPRSIVTGGEHRTRTELSAPPADDAAATARSIRLMYQSGGAGNAETLTSLVENASDTAVATAGVGTTASLASMYNTPATASDRGVARYLADATGHGARVDDTSDIEGNLRKRMGELFETSMSASHPGTPARTADEPDDLNDEPRGPGAGPMYRPAALQQQLSLRAAAALATGGGGSPLNSSMYGSALQPATSIDVPEHSAAEPPARLFAPPPPPAFGGGAGGKIPVPARTRPFRKADVEPMPAHMVGTGGQHTAATQVRKKQLTQESQRAIGRIYDQKVLHQGGISQVEQAGLHASSVLEAMDGTGGHVDYVNVHTQQALACE